MDPGPATPSTPSRQQVKRWRRYLAAERAEAAVYRDLASRRTGEDREILLALADAEGRHERHWLGLLGDDALPAPRTDWRTAFVGWLTRRFGGVFVLALAQRAESRSDYEGDADATSAMAADERIHGEVVRALAARGRQRLSGTLRAAVFGANDGLVSNLALVLAVSGAGLDRQLIVFTGVAGLLAGALSMGAGEYLSVRSQRELLDATVPDDGARHSIPHLDVDENELALVYRARGLSESDAAERAREVLAGREQLPGGTRDGQDAHEAVGSAFRAALSSFLFFASGAVVPIIPFLFGLGDLAAVIVSAVLVGVALLVTGSIVGLLSGASPLKRALRQLTIGYAAAAVTYALGLAFGVTLA